jgi:hypothetical protein
MPDQASLVGDLKPHRRRGSNQMARSMAVQARWPRIYRMLKGAGHDPAEAAGILLAAERKSDRALALIKTVRASTTTTFDF